MDSTIDMLNAMSTDSRDRKSQKTMPHMYQAQGKTNLKSPEIVPPEWDFDSADKPVVGATLLTAKRTIASWKPKLGFEASEKNKTQAQSASQIAHFPKINVRSARCSRPKRRNPYSMTGVDAPAIPTQVNLPPASPWGPSFDERYGPNVQFKNGKDVKYTPMSPEHSTTSSGNVTGKSWPSVSARAPLVTLPPYFLASTSTPSGYVDQEEPKHGETWSDIHGNEVVVKNNGIVPVFTDQNGTKFVWNYIQYVWHNADDDYNVSGMWCRVASAPLVDSVSSDSELSEQEQEEEEEDSDNSPHAGDIWIYDKPDNNDVEGVEQQFVVEWDGEREQFVFYDDEQLHWLNEEKECWFDEDNFEEDEMEYKKKGEAVVKELDMDMDVGVDMDMDMEW